MDRRISRDWRAGDNFNRETSGARGRRPDRHALWALLLAIFTLVVAAASAHASSGGVATPGGGASPSTTPTAPTATTGFGSRVLRVGMEGDDVKVLNGIVKSKDYSTGVRLSTVFKSPTAGAVKEFQGEAGLRRTGVVNKVTSRALVHSMDRAGVTWYGPGFYGNRTACGKVLAQDHDRRRQQVASLRHQGDACLPWPFGRRPGDRPRAVREGLLVRSHRRHRRRRSGSRPRPRFTTRSPSAAATCAGSRFARD